jgi:hypothetical protein
LLEDLLDDEWICVRPSGTSCRGFLISAASLQSKLKIDKVSVQSYYVSTCNECIRRPGSSPFSLLLLP